LYFVFFLFKVKYLTTITVPQIIINQQLLLLDIYLFIYKTKITYEHYNL